MTFRVPLTFSSNLSFAARVLLTTALGSTLQSPFAAAQEAGSQSSVISALEDSGEDAVSVQDRIIVTARRREESAQDVPVALSVVSADTIEKSGAFTLNQLQQLVPNVQLFSFNPRNTNVNIRGLGSNVALASDGFEQGVGVYIDNVYYGRIGQTQFDLVDLQQIEVLRGPQGTLFGKNTTAGAINITSQKPAFDFGATGEVSAGENGYYQVRGTATGPIIEDVVAYRLTFAKTNKEGFIYNRATDEDVQSYQNLTARGQLLVNLSPDIELRLIGDYSEQDSRSTITVPVGFFDTYDNGAVIPNNFSSRIARAGYSVPSFNPFDQISDADAHFQADMKSYGLSAEFNADIGWADLTSITAYRGWDWYPANDGDQLGLDILPVAQQQNNQRQFSQEFRVAGDVSEAIDYVAGAYYFRQHVNGKGSQTFGSDAANWFIPTAPSAAANLAVNGLNLQTRSRPFTESYGLFGQTNWALSDRVSLTTGLRYTYEEKSGFYSLEQLGPNPISSIPLALQPTVQAIRNNFGAETYYETAFEDKDLSGLVTLSYKLTPASLIYGTYSRGNKSGGLNLTNLPANVDPNVKPETVNHVEFGLKSELFDRRLTANVAVYRTDVTDFQTTITEQTPNSTSLRQYISNIPKVRSRGIETDLNWFVNSNVRATASVAYVDAYYVDYKNAPQAPENLNLGGIQDLSGEPLSGVPELTYALGIDAFRQIGSFGGSATELYSRADYSRRSSYYTAATNSRYSEVPAYGILNLRAGVRAESGAWDIAVYALNALDEDYLTTLTPQAFGYIQGLVGEPRQVGVTFRTKL